MTVNDGLPLDEPAADPPTDMLPRTVAIPADAASDLPTQALPLGPQPAPPDSAVEGSVEGDLFDGVADR